MSASEIVLENGENQKACTNGAADKESIESSPVKTLVLENEQNNIIKSNGIEIAPEKTPIKSMEVAKEEQTPIVNGTLVENGEELKEEIVTANGVAPVPNDTEVQEKQEKSDTNDTIATPEKEKVEEDKKPNIAEVEGNIEITTVVQENPVTNGIENDKKQVRFTGNDSIEKEELPKKTPTKTVEGVVARLKNDTTLSDSDKIDTLCLLVQRIVEENTVLKDEITIVEGQCEKQREAKEAIKTLNEAYKKQIELVKEESKLRLEEEQAKREAGIGGYSDTMTELSSLLETHTAQNSRLRDENTGMGEQMRQLIGESEKRDEYITRCQTEARLQITLLQHQVQKAQIEKAELKADMTKERLELSQELLLERERSRNLEEQTRILREQAEAYQGQMEELQAGAGQSTKSFQHFKTQIDRLTSAMGQLEKDTAQWRQKYEVSSGQVKKMNTTSMEREKEMTALKKKLESMVKLNKVLTEERTSLQKKIKQKDTQ